MGLSGLLVGCRVVAREIDAREESVLIGRSEYNVLLFKLANLQNFRKEPQTRNALDETTNRYVVGVD